MTALPDWLEVSEHVKGALNELRPIVALESTLIAHGLPWPVNLETALAAEQAVREQEAIPATIGVWKGKPTYRAARLAFDFRNLPFSALLRRGLFKHAQDRLENLG
jgi:hypothetical protein